MRNAQALGCKRVEVVLISRGFEVELASFVGADCGTAITFPRGVCWFCVYPLLCFAHLARGTLPLFRICGIFLRFFFCQT
jgi:hypothetical protein